MKVTNIYEIRVKREFFFEEEEEEEEVDQALKLEYILFRIGRKFRALKNYLTKTKYRRNTSRCEFFILKFSKYGKTDCYKHIKIIMHFSRNFLHLE